MRVEGEVVVDASSQIGTARAPQFDQDGRSIDMHCQRHLFVESLQECSNNIISYNIIAPAKIYLGEKLHVI